jgi:hypothetical protein
MSTRRKDETPGGAGVSVEQRQAEQQADRTPAPTAQQARYVTVWAVLAAAGSQDYAGRQP